jgi:hypothetical protein
MSTLRIQRGATKEQRSLERRQVQRLANMVTDETHWQHILASAHTEEQREELERVVAPLLVFRRAAVCTTPECVSGQPGVYQPVLEVRSPLAAEDVAYVPIERLRLCEQCKAEAKVQHFLTDDIWQQIMGAWTESTIPPVRRLTTLAFDRVH